MYISIKKGRGEREREIEIGSYDVVGREGQTIVGKLVIQGSRWYNAIPNLRT